MTDIPEVQSTFCPVPQRKFVLISAILASALGFIDGSVISIATPAIRENLDASLTDAQWISNGYMLTLSALILLGGAVGDRFGLKRVFSVGIALFVAMSMLCALAWSAHSLIVFRALQGVGAAFMIPGSLAIISKAYPKNERGKAIGTWAAASAITTAAGPVIAGLVLSQGSPDIWRWIFAVNLPLGGLALWMLATKVPQDKPLQKKALDFAGAALAIVFLGALAWGLTGSGGESGEGGLPSPGHLAFWLLVSLAALLAFIFVEKRMKNPVMPLHVFANRRFDAANLATFCLYFSLSAILFYLPMTLIGGWGLSETQVGLTLVPLAVAIALFSGPAGALADRTGPGILIAIGSAMVALAYGILAAGINFNSFWLHILPSIVVMSLGMALVVAPLSAAVMGSIDDADTGTASGVNNAVSRVAGLVAVAAMGGLAAWRYGLVGSPGDFGLPFDGAEQEAHRLASNSAMAAVAWFSAGMSAMAALLALFGLPKPVVTSEN